MDEYISKHDAYTLMKDLEAAYIYPPIKEVYATAARHLDQMQAADVQPVKHGHWLPSDACITIDCQVCSECRSNILMDRFYYDYCPICGARMDLKEGEKNAD